MKSQQTLQAEAKNEPAMMKTQDVTRVRARQLLERMKETYQAVENRAYELFAERDYESGHDLEDWIGAEAEFLAPSLQVQVVETESQIIVTTTIPDLSQTSISVGVLPKRLILNGTKRRNSDNMRDTQDNGREFFVLLHLPGKVETANVKARASGDGLELSLHKRNAEPEARRKATGGVRPVTNDR